MNTKIVTYTGKVFDYLNPTPEMVCIEDIAHHLSLICRYTGATQELYSVAQHCVLMAKNVELPGDPLAKLLHDASEAYTGDMVSPWKQLLWVTTPESFGAFRPVREYEQKIQDVIGLATGVDLSHSAGVKKSDDRMYHTEVRDLMPPHEELRKWKGNLEPVTRKIVPWIPALAERKFLWLYNQLTRERVSG